MRILIITLLLLFLISPSISQAELFRNAYLSFELPPNWRCRNEVTEWVCISKFSKKSKEAIIILTAKEKGPTDSLQQYEGHLKQKKTLTTKKGKQIMSHVYTVKKVQINGHTWVDGLHISSEVENYYTRYMATTKGPIAVLVTFSGHRQHYTKYSADFFKAIKSLRVIPPQFGQAGNSGRKKFKGKGNSEVYGRGGMGGLKLPNDAFPEEDSTGFSDMQTNIIAIAMILAAIGFYLIRKRKKRK